MDTLNYILNKFFPEKAHQPAFVEYSRMPLEIPNFGRENLTQLFRELRFDIGAEIGTEQGVYSESLLIANPDLSLFSIDGWKAYRGYRDHTRQEKLDRFYQITKDRLAPFKERSVIIKRFSMDAIELFKDNSLDFVYIDANHDFYNVTLDIYNWSRKVKPGGIISGHDYIKRKDEAAHVHVPQVLSGYTDAYRIRPWFVLGTNAVVEGEIRDRSRSWMFVKQ